HRASLLTAPFLRIEEEDPVLLDRPVEVKAEVVIAQLLLGLAPRIQQEIGRIERVIAEEFKGRAVKLIAASFCDQIDNSALRLTEFRAEAVAFDTELLNRVNRREDQQRGVRSHIHIIDAVNGPYIRIRLVAVDRHVYVPVKPSAAGGKR